MQDLPWVVRTAWGSRFLVGLPSCTSFRLSAGKHLLTENKIPCLSLQFVFYSIGPLIKVGNDSSSLLLSLLQPKNKKRGFQSQKRVTPPYPSLVIQRFHMASGRTKSMNSIPT